MIDKLGVPYQHGILCPHRARPPWPASRTASQRKGTYVRVSQIAGASAAILLVTGLTACATSSAEEAVTGSGSDGFPIEVEHVYGTTTIETKPERVATVAWANHEVPLALGVVPVGMSKATWGDDDGDGVLPWVEDRLEELGADTPVLFDETDGIDYEAVADTQPDVILAAYSGLTEEEYETLSKIAPVVAYPEDSVAWGASVSDMIRLDSQALGLEDEGDALIEDLTAHTQEALEANEGLQDQRVLFALMDPSNLSTIGFYTSHDTRPGFLESFGMPVPAIVEEETAKTEEFYVEVSSDLVDRFEDVDVFVTYGEPDGGLVEQMQDDPLLSQIPAVAAGDVVILEESTPLAASANPSPLSIEWGIEDYFAALNSTSERE